MNFKLWLETDNTMLVYHAKTKGDFDKPSANIGSDFDIMGRGFYFSTSAEYVRQHYGEPEAYRVRGPFANTEQWVQALKKYKGKRPPAQAYLKQQGYRGILQKNVGVIWDQSAFLD